MPQNWHFEINVTCSGKLSQLKLEFSRNDPPRKTVPQEVGNFGLRSSVSARLAGTIAVNVTQVMVSSKSFDIGAQVGSLPAAAGRWKCGKRAAFSKAA
jgi:hypothetical protein